MACGFAGNPDVYGIGIRIGYYTQALAVWFANYYHFREAKVLRSVNNLFLVALTIVGLIYVYDARKVYAVEAFLLLHIGITMAVLSVLDGTRFTSRFLNVSNERLIAKMFMTLMAHVFLVAFWWKGLDVMRPTPCPGINGQPSNITAITKGTTQGTYGCYVVPANMYGWLRTLMRVLSLGGVIRWALVLTSNDSVKVVHSILTRRTKAAFIHTAMASSRGHAVLPTASVAREARQHYCGGRLPIHLGVPPDEVYPHDLPSLAHGHQDTDDKNDKQLVSFSAIFEAERYLDSVFTILHTAEAPRSQRREFSICKGYVRVYNPFRRAQPTSQLVPLRKCFDAMFIWYGVTRIPWNLKFRYHIHLTSLNKGPPLIWPRLMYRAFQLSELQRPPNWKTVAIASDAQLSQIPLKKSAKLWALGAVKNLFLIIGFIVQLEITIAWNHISSLNSFTSLGQLIPFVLGVGGFLKVLWSKWRLIQNGVSDDADRNSPPLTEYEAALKTYLEWKKLHRALSISAPTEQKQQVDSTNDARDSIQQRTVVTTHVLPHNSLRGLGRSYSC